MLAFAGLLLRELASSERHTLEARVQDTARALSMIVDQEIGQSQAVIGALSASHYLDVDDLERFHAQARRVLTKDDRWIVLFDRQRNQLVNTLRPYGANLPNGVDAPAVAAVLATGKPAIGDLLPSLPVAQRPVIVVAVPVVRHDEIIYVLALAVSTDALGQTLATQALPAGWRAGILDREMRIIARSHAPQQFVGRSPDELLRARIASQGDGVILVNTLEGEPAYAAFKRSEMTGWTSAVSAPQATLSAPLNRSLTMLLVGGVGLLLIAMAIAARSARQIADPVHRLTEAAIMLGHGAIPEAPLTGISEVNEVGKTMARAAVELRERQARLRAALDIVAMGIWRWDVRDRSVEWDAATNRIFGLEEKTTTHEPSYLLTYVHPDDRDRIVRESQEWLRKVTNIEAEFRIVRADGVMRWVYERGKMHVGEDGAPDYVIGAIVDITERKQTEDALRESEERLREAQDIAQLGRWEFDLTASTITWSDEVFKIFGRDKHLGEPSYDELREMIHPDDRPEFDAVVGRALKEGESFDIEWRALRPDGSHRWKRTQARPYRDKAGNVVRLVGTDIDITERKRTEEALAEAHDHTLEILESITDAFYALDADLRLTYANRKAFEWWKKPASEVIGKRLIDIFPQLAASEAWAAQEQAARDRHPLHLETVSPLVHRWISLSIYPTAGGGLTVYFRDISARKDAERRQQLLIGELNHRVKNTLAAVQSIVAQGLRAKSAPDDFARALQGRLMALSGAHDLLTRTAWEGADLGEVVQVALAPFDVGNRRLSIEGPPIDVQPNVAVALSMAFHELATNAAKYGALSNADGHVSVTWRLEEPSTFVIIQWCEIGGPSVTPPSRRGFGSRLIERGLAYELDSEVDLSFLPNGVECRIRLPLSHRTDTLHKTETGQ